MAHYVERQWRPDAGSGLSRKDRAPGTYLAYVPDELGSHFPMLTPATHAAAAEAHTALLRADERLSAGGEHLHYLLVRAESIASSWIEGKRVTPKALVLAEALGRGTSQALDVARNVRATQTAITELGHRTRPLTVRDLEDLQHVVEPKLERGIRREQNWVAGPGWSPMRASYVPPPEGDVERLMADLAQFASRTDGNPVIRAALAHAQFETIHPFLDGNGRTGRALIHAILVRGGALTGTVVPISAVFAAETDGYFASLGDFRADPPGLDAWVSFFSQAVTQAAAKALALAADVDELDASNSEEWPRLLGSVTDQRSSATSSLARRYLALAALAGR